MRRAIFLGVLLKVLFSVALFSFLYPEAIDCLLASKNAAASHQHPASFHLSDCSIFITTPHHNKYFFSDLYPLNQRHS